MQSEPAGSLPGGVPGSDFLQLQPDDAPRRGLAGWLAGSVRSAITDGRLGAGQFLPPTRALARDLGISRGVVAEAYDRLQAEGLVEGRGRAGTAVVGSPPAGPPPKTAEPARIFTFRVPELPAVLSGPRPHVEFDLSPGLPDLGAFPRAGWLRAQREVLASMASSQLGYGDPRGHHTLREELARYLTRLRGVRARPDDIIVVNGVAQGLALLAHTLAGAGLDAIGVEDPGSRGARDELAFWGLRPVPLVVDQEGLDVGRLMGGSLRAVLMTPAHQFPTGAVLSPGRRRQVVKWAAGGGLLVEDDYDAEYRYDRAPVPALQASVPEQTVYLGSVSKILAPALRIGWVVAPASLHEGLLRAKEASDISTATLPQLALARMLATGGYERHIRRTRARQRERRNAVVEACRAYMPRAEVRGIAAGLNVLVAFPGAQTGATDVEVAQRALAAGVLVHPLSVHRQLPGEPGLVIGYAAHTPDELTAAIGRLAGVVGSLVV